MAVRQEHGLSVTGDAREETLEGKADDAEVPFRYDRMGTSGNAIHERNLLGVRLDRLGLHLSG